MNLSYRKATTEDVEILIAIARSALGRNTYSPIITEDEWTKELNKVSVFVIELDQKLVGLISYEMKSNHHAYISDLIILPSFQGKGLAKMAMEHTLQQLENTSRVDLVVHPDNNPAINLYKSFGFVEESRKENYFGDGQPRLVMVLDK